MNEPGLPSGECPKVIEQGLFGAVAQDSVCAIITEAI